MTGSGLVFRFRGKSGQQHELRLKDRRLAALVRRCQELPGQQLFEYLDENDAVEQVRSEDVNDYLRRISGAEITARDLRTWAGTVLAYRELARQGEPGPNRTQQHKIAAAVDAVAEQLGNTRTVARASYIHPTIVDAWRTGSLPEPRRPPEPGGPPTPREEREVIAVLERPPSSHARRP